LFSLLLTTSAWSQSNPDDHLIASEEEVLYYSYQWDGKRFADGRPKVSDELLERVKNIRVEDAWQYPV